MLNISKSYCSCKRLIVYVQLKSYVKRLLDNPLSKAKTNKKTPQKHQKQTHKNTTKRHCICDRETVTFSQGIATASSGKKIVYMNPKWTHFIFKPKIYVHRMI